MQEYDIKLRDVIDVGEMKKILNSFVLATGLGAVCVDAQGELAIVPDEHEGYCQFCKEIRRDHDGRRRCNDSMNKAGKLAAQLGEPYIYRCHAGLVELAAPILFKDLYLGSISCGPVLMWDWDDSAIEEVLVLTQDLDINREMLIDAGNKINMLAGSYEHEMGVKPGGNMAILAGVGPMGLGAIDYALHNERKPKLLVVTDINEERLARAASIYTVEEAAKNGIKLVYVNTGSPDKGVEYLMGLTDGRGYDDVFVFAPVKAVVKPVLSFLVARHLPDVQKHHWLA
jgi:ligand-binding sensor protein